MEGKTAFKLGQVPVTGPTGTEDTDKSPMSKWRCETKCQQATETAHQLTRRLVGSRHIAKVTVGGVQQNCLMDGGSQVTTITKSFHEIHLPSHPIIPIQDLLHIEGAAGQLVPYLGCIEVDIAFPEHFTGEAKVVTTLALIVPDPKTQVEVPVLIGTNTLDILYAGFKEGTTISPDCEYASLIRHLQSIYLSRAQQDGQVGRVKLQSKNAIVIPAGKKVALNGRARHVTTVNGAPLLVEPPTKSSLPGGLILCSYIMASPRQTSFKVPILLKNESAHDITVSAHRILAELSVPQSISPLASLHGIEGEMQDLNGTNTAAQDLTAGQVNPENLIQFDFAESPLSEEWKNRITTKLNSIPEVFARGDLDYGHTTAVKHKIRLSDPTPFKQRARPIHPSDYEAVRLHLEELYEANIIRESESPFASPIVVVKKKNGQIRLCVDYRKLNSQTIKDAYALPHIEEAFASLTGAKWFSVMDLKSGYYQVEMDEEDKHKTAFVTPMGFWEFNRMPQGVTNAPSTFQRVMEKCMGSLNHREVLVFLDDLIVFSNTLEEHEERLLKVLNRLREFGLKLSPEKCHFFRKTVKYLGHIVSEDGVKTDPDKIAALTSWPRPNNISELKSFLGFTGYYRRFVRDYSKIAKPLNDLTAGYVPAKKKKHDNTSKSQRSFSNADLRKPFDQKWTPSCEEAFKTLIERLTTAPVLGFADSKKPYILHTDASSHGLGATLYQEQDGQMKVIAYASRGLSNCERRYPTHKLEFLSLKWAITDKFADYLYGVEFTVFTDNNPLTYVLTSAKLDACGHRWLADLSNFNFSISYRAGKKNQDADGLSRRPHAPAEMDNSTAVEDERVRQFVSKFVKEGDGDTFPREAVKAICERHQLDKNTATDEESGHLPVIVECLAMDEHAICPGYAQADLLPGSTTLPRMSQQDWALEQRNDPIINRVIDIVRAGKHLTYRLRLKEEREVQLLLRVQDQLILRDEVLYRKCKSEDQLTFQLVLPKNYRQTALKNLHDDVGHLGYERTVDLVRARFYWPRMCLEVEEKVRRCERCLRRKARAEKTAPLVNIKTNRPLQLVCMDYLSLEPDGRGTKDILVITDHFTKYAVAVSTPDQKEKTVAKALWNNFLVHYGIPERLHSDQGRNFESAVIKNLCDLLGIKKSRTTPYHPRGNPVERFNRTLLAMLGTLEEVDKVKWRDYVQPLVHAYNCTKNDTTGFSPYQLMYGRQPNLPIDVAFGLHPQGQRKVTHSEYVKKLRETLEESYKLAVEHSDKTALRNKQRYDLKVRESKLQAGDRVLVKNVGIRGKHKIADKWSQTIYKVVRHIGDSPVYVVVPLTSKGPERTLHRDLLLPCGFLTPSESVEADENSLDVRQGTTAKPSQRNPVPEVEEAGNPYDSDEGDELDYPSINPDDVTYPSFTTVHDIPRTTTKPPLPLDVSPGGSGLNPIAEEFHPQQAEREEHSDTSQVPSVEAEEDNNSPADPLPVDETNLTVEGVGQSATVPVDESPTVPNESVNGEPKRGTDDTELTNQNQRAVKEENERDNVEEEIELTDTSSVQDGTEPEARWPTRTRKEPDRLAYRSLGNPLTLVMRSILHSLDQVFTEALDLPSVPSSSPSPYMSPVTDI